MTTAMVADFFRRWIRSTTSSPTIGQNVDKPCTPNDTRCSIVEDGNDGRESHFVETITEDLDELNKILEYFAGNVE